MKIEILNFDIVLLAQKFNPSILTKDWLLQKKIFNDEPKEFVNTNGLSFFEDDKFVLQIDDTNLILRSKSNDEKALEFFKNFIDLLTKALPETPYSAIGMNIFLAIKNDNADENILKLIRDKYCLNQKNVVEILKDTEFNFGFTLNYKEKKNLVTFVVTPKVNDNEYQVSINFHKDIMDKEFKETNKLITEFTQELASNYDYAQKIASRMFIENSNTKD